MKCSVQNCENQSIEGYDKCILHQSNNCVDEINNKENENEFVKKFHDYILNEIKKFNKHKEGTSNYDMKKRREYIESIKKISISVVHENEELLDILADNTLYFKDMDIPEYIDKYLLGYNYILEKIGDVYFINCNFYGNWYSKSYNIFHINCSFKKDVCIYANVKLDEDNDNKEFLDNKYRYRKCIFENDVCIKDKDNKDCINYSIFYECVFRKKLSVKNVSIYEEFLTLPNYTKEEGGIINLYNTSKEVEKNKIDNMFNFLEIDIDNSVFFKTIKINGINDKDIRKYKKYISNKSSVFEKPYLRIGSIKIENTKIKRKLEIKNAEIERLDFYDSNVYGIFDMNESSIKKSEFNKSVFEDFASFEKVEFGKEDDFSQDYQTKFIYTTFKDFSNFRNTKFKSGLSFSSANLKQDPNFLDTEINLDGTDRETLRIVKNSFEKVNNKIESNRFFVYEMKKYRKETRWRKNPFRKFILNANFIISGFGSNYIFPVLILLASITVYVYFLTYQNEWVANTLKLVESIGGDKGVLYFSKLTYYANEGSKVIIPFNKLLESKKGLEFISLLFFVWFGILTWQIIVAVKRNTQH